MMADFRRTFHPTVEEQIQDYELLLRLHKEQLGHCSTCANHISSDMPGYVTDYGDCTVDSPLFPAKVCGLEDKICPLYAERSVEPLEQEIEMLKRDRPPEGDADA